MGPADDSTAVVDQEGRVYGVDNLRVIDASIMPDCPSVNLNGTVMMMAEKLAATLRGEVVPGSALTPRATTEGHGCPFVTRSNHPPNVIGPSLRRAWRSLPACMSRLTNWRDPSPSSIRARGSSFSIDSGERAPRGAQGKVSDVERSRKR